MLQLSLGRKQNWNKITEILIRIFIKCWYICYVPIVQVQLVQERLTEIIVKDNIISSTFSYFSLDCIILTLCGFSS